VKLHSKLVQNVFEGRVRRHAKPGHEKLFKYHSLVICRLRNNLFLELPCIAFSETMHGQHLLNA
jgi:hypothetical protein